MVGVHTTDVGLLGVFNAMAWSRFRRTWAKTRESADVAHDQCATVLVDQNSELLHVNCEIRGHNLCYKSHTLNTDRIGLIY